MTSRLVMVVAAACVALVGTEARAQISTQDRLNRQLNGGGTVLNGNDSSLPSGLAARLKIKPLGTAEKARFKAQRAQLKVRVPSRPLTFSTKVQVAGLIGSSPAQLQEPFDLSAANPFVANRGSFSAYRAWYSDPEVPYVQFLDGEFGHVELRLHSLTPGKLVVVECGITAMGTVAMHNGETSVSSVFPSTRLDYKTLVFAFRATRSDHLVAITRPEKKTLWVPGCRVTPEQ